MEKEYLNKTLINQIYDIPEDGRWNEFKDVNYHKKLWEKFWKNIFVGSKTDNIMDFGCGPCWGGFIAKNLGFNNINNLDIDNKEVKTSFKRYTDILKQEVTYYDGKNIPFDNNYFNSLVAKASIMKCVDSEFDNIINELIRCTASNGKWYISPYDMHERLIKELKQSTLDKKIASKNISIIAWTWKKWEIRNIYINKIFKKDRFINNQLTRLSNKIG